MGKARFYSPYLNHFIQPDTLIPDPSNPQTYNRFGYVQNNPINFNDPTGHKPGCLEDKFINGKCLDDVGYLKYELQQTYKIKLKGNWKEKELENLSASLAKTAEYVGGIDKLNDYFLKISKKAFGIFIERISDPRPYGKSAAAWCRGSSRDSCSPNTIVFGDDVFTRAYQLSDTFLGTDRGPALFNRPPSYNLNTAIQFSMVHEFSHILIDRNPNALKTYQQSFGSQMTDENLANELALQIIEGGNSFDQALNPDVWGY